MRKSLSCLLAIFAGGCATGVAPADVVKQAPPSIALVKQQIDAQPPCQIGRPVGAPVPHKPRLLFDCTPAYPQVLAEAGIEGSCTTMFDVDDAGVPRAVESRCAVYDRVTPASKQWLELAKQSFEHAAASAVSLSRFAPFEASDRYANVQVDRNNLSRSAVFAMEGFRPCLDAPREFVRPPPAPVPPPFIVIPPGPDCPPR